MEKGEGPREPEQVASCQLPAPMTEEGNRQGWRYGEEMGFPKPPADTAVVILAALTPSHFSLALRQGTQAGPQSGGPGDLPASVNSCRWPHMWIS